MMIRILKSISGFSLIEVIIIIVVLGIIAGIAMKSMTASVDDARQLETRREMDMLAAAIAGDPSLRMAGTRADFGYIGDVGSFPPNLQALSQNPGGYLTWHGPYLPPGFTQDTDGYKTDAWGQPYAYSGGTSIISSGDGSSIIRKIADAASDYLLNSFHGIIRDAADSVPGSIYWDSITIVITIPNGFGGMTNKTYTPGPDGSFTLDSLPVGTHPLRFIFTPVSDTLIRYITILPRNKGQKIFKFATHYFSIADPGLVNPAIILASTASVLHYDEHREPLRFQS